MAGFSVQLHDGPKGDGGGGEQGCGSNYVYFDVGELMTMMVLAALHLDREELSFWVYLRYVFSVLGIKNEESQQMDMVTSWTP